MLARLRAFVSVRFPPWVTQTATLIGVYLVLMAIVTKWMPVWYDIDAHVLAFLDARIQPGLSRKVVLIDVRDWSPKDIPTNRKTVAYFLQGLAAGSAGRPRAVIIDIEFGPCPLVTCPGWNAARDQLVKALDDAAKHIPVYIVEGVKTNRVDHVISIDDTDPEIYSHHEEIEPRGRELNLYAHVTDVAHTHAFPLSDTRVLSYRQCYALRLADREVLSLWSMASLMEFRAAGTDATQAPCDATHTELRYGATVAPLRNGYAFMSPSTGYSITAGKPFPSGADFGDDYVILGWLSCPTEDDSACDRTLGHSGPELLAWAISDDLESNGTVKDLDHYYVTHPDNRGLLLFVPVFSALTVLAFTAWFLLLRRLRLAALRRFLPLFAAALALVVGMVAFVLFEMWDLLSLGTIQPQVALISFGMLVAGCLSFVRANAVIFEDAMRIDVITEPDPDYDYDVFVSYAHEELPWVLKYVYTPLQNARIPDGSKGGRKLKLFFDTKTIAIGTSWERDISLSIDGSTFIIPVFSDIYFSRPYCYFELARAHRKFIASRMMRCVFPIMRGHPAIPEEFDEFQAESVDGDPAVIAKTIDEIVTRLSKRDFGRPQTSTTSAAESNIGEPS